MDPEIQRFLSDAEVDVSEDSIPVVAEILQSLGVRKFTDLEFVKVEDLADSGLSVIERRRFVSVARERVQGLSVLERRRFLSLEEPRLEGTTLFGGASKLQQYHATRPQSSRQFRKSKGPTSITVRYIICDGKLFVHDTVGGIIKVPNMHMLSLEFLVQEIVAMNEIQMDDLCMELFSKEGYPLFLSMQKAKLTLQKWGVQDNDLFYAFLRPKDQSDIWESNIIEKGQTPQKAELDLLEGSDQLQVYYLFEEKLMIKLDLSTATTDVIKKKVAAITGLSTKVMTLYAMPLDAQSAQTKLELRTKLKDDEVCNLKPGSVIFLHLDSGSLVLQEYGKLTYKPRKDQTDLGYSKFYSILMYLVRISSEASNPTQSAIITAVQKLARCPPLTFALMLLMEQKGFIHISHMAVLFEGFYQLCQAMLRDFCDMRKIPDSKTLEFSDYMFGLILQEAKNVKKPLKVKKIYPYCPITTRKVLHPAMTKHSADQLFEKHAIAELIKGKLSLPHDKGTKALEDKDLVPVNLLWQKLLLYNTGTSLEYLYAWEDCLEEQDCIQAFTSGLDWKKLLDCLKLVRIMDPASLPSESPLLTFIEKGRVVCAIDVTKSAEAERRVYDPLDGEEVCYTKDVLEGFSSEGKTAYFLNLIEYLKPKMKAAAIEDHGDTIAKGVSLDPSDIARLSGSTEEAIMVLIDTSGSMSENVFDEGARMLKVDAAKVFFQCFATRTEAYQLKHALSAIIFSQSTKILHPFTELLSHFRTSLKEIKTGGNTALYDALMRAIDELKKFVKKDSKCKARLRILVLSDGEDNRSGNKPYQVAERLQKENIVVDAVLITDARGNLQLKAIAHATGGFCFLPKSRAEAIRLFEMEPLLTLSDRRTSLMSYDTTVSNQRTFDVYTDLTKHPYNKTDLYCYESKFLEEFKESDCCEADRYVQLADLIHVRAGEKSASTPVVDSKRILTELRNCIRNPHEDIKVLPSESNMQQWKLLIKGPEGTPYHGGSFVICVNFPNGFPSKPPEMRFLTPIYHCNINSSGRICHAIFGRSYSPSKTMDQIIEHVYGLFSAPEPDDPLDSVLAEEYHTNHARYQETARRMTKEYAMKESYDQVLQRLVLDNLAGTSATCVLSKKLFEDPVMTPFGNTYERSFLMKHMKEFGNTDPCAHNSEFDPKELKPDLEAKKLADEVRRLKRK